MTRLLVIPLLIGTVTCKEKQKPYSPPEVFEVDESASTPKPTAHQEISTHMKSQEEIAREIQEEAKFEVKNSEAQAPQELIKEEKPEELSSEQLAAMIEEESEDEIELNHIILDTIREEMSDPPPTEGQAPKDRLFLKGLKAIKEGDIETAKDNYLKSCQLGHYHSCHKFAYYEQKEGNFTNAIRFYKISCGKGIFKSCNNLAFGAEQAGDYESAKDYYSKACINKHEISCKNLRRLLIKENLAH